MKTPAIPRAAAGDPPLRREIHPEVRIIDATRGIVDYVASDETIDYYKEVIRAAGWKFTHFVKNSPFVDSHDYSTISKLLGGITEFGVVAGKLIERAQWAIGQGNELADLGWKMTVGGFLKAVSVGFYPTRLATRFDSDPAVWLQQLKELGLSEADGVRTIYIEQEQIELSACIIGANPNALAKAYRAGCLSEEDLDKLSRRIAREKTASAGMAPAGISVARRRVQLAILMEIQRSL